MIVASVGVFRRERFGLREKESAKHQQQAGEGDRAAEDGDSQVLGVVRQLAAQLRASTRSCQ